MPSAPTLSSDPAAALDSLRNEVARLRGELQERDDLMAMTAHELRNPLHGLSLQMRLVRKAAEDAPAAGGVLARVVKAESMLVRYIERLTVLLDVTRLNANAFPVKPAAVDLSRVLAGLVDNLAAEAQFRQVTVALEAPAHVMARTDPGVLEQVVGNLMLNAFKHAACTTVTVRLRADENGHEIAVQDDGRGIAVADQQRIFGKFSVSEATERGAGTGLGLWIVRKLLIVLGGTLSLQSQPGAGSTFTLTFPTVPHRDFTP